MAVCIMSVIVCESRSLSGRNLCGLYFDACQGLQLLDTSGALDEFWAIFMHFHILKYEYAHMTLPNIPIEQIELDNRQRQYIISHSVFAKENGLVKKVGKPK